MDNGNANPGAVVSAREGRRRDWTPYAIYTLGFLTAISAFNYLDRTILGLAMPAIKKEMAVSDTALGLISGLVFVTFYSVLGIPIAWLADRYNRRNIIAVGLLFWSLMTIATGYVANIWQLAFTRFLMGAGEASSLAPSNSIVSDVFQKARRPLALAIFGLANSIASLAFLPVVGWIGQTRGWRAMFVAAGVPGLLLALLFVLTVREPKRGEAETGRTRVAPESLTKALGFLAGSPTYWLLLFGTMFMGANVYGTGAWTPTFLSRVHSMSLAEIAATIGPIRGILGGIGVLGGGLLIDRLARRDERWRLGLPALACILVGPAEVLFLLGNGKSAWMTGFALAALFTLVHQPAVFAVTLDVARVNMRAVSTSIVILFANLFGQAVGPLIVGMVSDHLHPLFGDTSIRYALLVTTVTPILAGLCLGTAMRFSARDIARAAAP